MLPRANSTIRKDREELQHTETNWSRAPNEITTTDLEEVERPCIERALRRLSVSILTCDVIQAEGTRIV